jgi:hypothetical protein
MVITIHKLPVGSFTFLLCLSGTELLNLSGTPYISRRIYPCSSSSLSYVLFSASVYFHCFTAMSNISTHVCALRKPVDAKGMVRYLRLKRLNPPVTHSELESVHHKDTLTLPTLYKRQARFRDNRTRFPDNPRPARRRLSDLAVVISSMLKKVGVRRVSFWYDTTELSKP